MHLAKFACAAGVFFALAAPALAQNDGDCARKTAPGKFPFAEASVAGVHNPGNDGIRPGGFVDLGPDRPVVHGIDVSKYQDEASFTSVKTCGGSFGYVRLTSGTEDKNTHEDVNELLYRTHWANVRAADLLPGPYHHLSLLPVDTKAIEKDTPDVIRTKVAALNEKAIASARSQARHFLERLDELKRLDPIASNGQRSQYLPPALDLSERPGAGGSAAQQSAFAGLYATMVCTFLSEVRGTDASRRVILFINPKDFVTYELDATPCDLSSALIWIRHRPDDGDLFTSSFTPEVIKRLCATDKPGAFSHSVGRCIMDQYSSYGGFAVFDTAKPLDLDRFLGTREELDKLAASE